MDRPEKPVTGQPPAEVEGPAPPPPGAAPARRYGMPAFLVLFLAAGVLFIITITSTLAPILLGAILAAVTQPLHRRLARRLGHPNLSAAIITVLVVLAVVLPLGGLLFLVIQRLAATLGQMAAQGWFGAAHWQSFLREHPQVSRLVPGNLVGQLAAAAKFVAASLPAVLARIADEAVALFLTIIATYYFLRDAEWLFFRLERALPLEPRHTRAVADEFKRVGRAVIFGTIGTALLHGAATGVAYWAVGLHEPLVLGALTAVASLVPVLGSSLVIIPAALYLFASGQTLRAVLLVGAGLFVVGVIDNLLRPLLNRLGLEIHPLLAFLGIFGGLATFGASGLYLGPLFVALFLAVVRIYENEVAPAAAAAAPSGSEAGGAARTAAAAVAQTGLAALLSRRLRRKR